MKHLWKYLRPYRKESILAPSFKLLEALMDLFVPLVVASIIDNGIGAGNHGLIVRDFLLMVVLAAAGLGFSFTAQWFSARASVGFATNVRQSLFDHIQSLSYSQLDSMGNDTLITRLTSDVNQVQTGLNMALRLLLRSPFIVFGSMVMAFTIDVPSALIFVVAIPVLSVVIFGIMAASIPLYRKVQSALDGVTTATRENLDGVRVIRAFCREEDEVKAFDAKNDALTKINEFVGRLSALMNPASYFLINLATIFLIREDAIRVNMGSLEQGQVVALYNYMAQMIVELIKLASLIITINRSLACADRVAGILDIKPDMSYPEKTILPDGSSAQALQSASEQSRADAAVQANAAETEKDVSEKSASSNLSAPDEVVFDHVSFTYAGYAEDALHDVTFTARRGQTIGIIGGTGSGKSTLVNLIPRFYDVTQGEVKVDGLDVRNYAKKDLISRIGVVPQKAELFEGTIADNLRWGNPDATDDDLWQAVKTAQATEVVEGKEEGLETEVEQNGRNFSGGQKQRLTIARALVRKPEILIMDDSSSALDFATDAKLRGAIAGLENKMTVFIVSQRAASIRHADQIIVLDDGTVAGIGKHDDLLANCSAYQEIYYSQFPEERPKGGPGTAGKYKSSNAAQQVSDASDAPEHSSGRVTNNPDENAAGKEVLA